METDEVWAAGRAGKVWGGERAGERRGPVFRSAPSWILGQPSLPAQLVSLVAGLDV